MNEVQAALGLVQLKHHAKNIEKRKTIAETYRKNLKDIKGISLLPELEKTDSNYSYFPIFVDEKEYGMSRDELYEKLKQHGIFGRRYFYPLISEFSMYKGLDSAKPDNLPVAEKIAEQVICLPIYPDLKFENIKRLAEILK